MNTIYYKNDDERIAAIEQLLPPVALLESIPASDKAVETVKNNRRDVNKIVSQQDDRLLVVIGPCSIHDVVAAKEYAERLKPLCDKYRNELLIVMRVYFEKPRTTVGWKGLINDPYLDESFSLNDGIRIARRLLADINDLGIPTAGEFLDMITPQYLADFMTWGAIGARTTESQVHRELSSGLSCSVGFKNATNGGIKIAIDAIGSASKPHHFLSVTKFGHSAIVTTVGNPYCHVILRGGDNGPNYSEQHVDAVAADLVKAGYIGHVMVDFSHANSEKKFKKQLDVSNEISRQIANGSEKIFGVMIESNLVEGAQSLTTKDQLVYGQSITDSCISFSDSEIVLAQLAEAVKERRNLKK